MLSIRADKTRCFGGETAKAEGWICNDTERTGAVRMRYELVEDGRVIASCEQDAEILANRAVCHSVAEFKLPVVGQRKVLKLRAMLMDENGCVAWNELNYNVLPACG